MKKLFTLFLLTLFALGAKAGEVDITSSFSYTWNGEESFSTNEDGVIVFEAVQWGGLASWRGAEDWSGYEKLVVEFAEATTVGTQILIQGASPQVSQFADAGSTSLEATFAGHDMTAVSQVALQANAAGTVYVKRIYLVEKENDQPVDPTQDQTLDLLPKFTGTWNEAETITTNSDGSKEYTSVEWGGMAAWLGGADWSNYDALIIEFADATTCATKVAVIGPDIELNQEAGITSITIPFEGYDMTAVEQVGLQTAEAVRLTVTKAYLIKYGQAESELKFDAENTSVQAMTFGMDDEEPETVTVKFPETGWGQDGENIIKSALKSFVINSFNTKVTGGTASSVKVVAWVYHADKQRKDDDSKEFELTAGDDGMWSCELNIDILPMLGEEDDWIMELYFEGQDASGNTFMYNNGGENYKVFFNNKVSNTIAFDKENSSMTATSVFLQEETGEKKTETATMPLTDEYASQQIHGTLLELVINSISLKVINGKARDVCVYAFCSPANSDAAIVYNEFERGLTEGEDGVWTADNMTDVLTSGLTDGDWVLQYTFRGNDVETGKEFWLKTDTKEPFKVYFTYSAGTQKKKGDVNGDGVVNISDIVAVINQMAGTSLYPYANVNGDGKVDISDVVSIINIIAGASAE